MILYSTSLLGFAVPENTPGWVLKTKGTDRWMVTGPHKLIKTRYNGGSWRYTLELDSLYIVVGDEEDNFCTVRNGKNREKAEFYKETIEDGILITEYFFDDMIVATFKTEGIFEAIVKTEVAK